VIAVAAKTGAVSVTVHVEVSGAVSSAGLQVSVEIVGTGELTFSVPATALMGIAEPAADAPVVPDKRRDEVAALEVRVKVARATTPAPMMVAFGPTNRQVCFPPWTTPQERVLLVEETAGPVCHAMAEMPAEGYSNVHCSPAGCAPVVESVRSMATVLPGAAEAEETVKTPDWACTTASRHKKSIGNERTV
jgi:hypothetical protein